MKRLKSSNKVVGIKQTRNAIKNDCAEVVFIASDTDADMAEELTTLCDEFKLERVFVNSRAELAKLCGITVPRSCAAVLKKTEVDDNKKLR